MYIASAATTLKVHDFTTGELVHNYRPGTDPDGPIRSVSWSKDGWWLLVVPHSGHAEVITIRDRLKLLKTIKAVQYPTSACFQHSTKKRLAIGSMSGLTIVYDVKSRRAQKEFQGPSDEITHVRFTAQDSHCVAACRNGKVFVYNCVMNGRPQQLSVPKSKTVTCLGTHPSKKNLVVGGSAEGMVVIWDLNVNRSKFQTRAHQTAINCVSFSPNKCELISTAGQDRQCYLFDTNTGNHVANLSLENTATSMDFTCDAKHFILGHQKGYVSIYDLRNMRKPLRTFQAHDKSVKHLFYQPFGEKVDDISEMDISVESRRSVGNTPKPRFSDLFSVSNYSPTFPSNGISHAEDSPGTAPGAFSVDSSMSLSMNNDGVFDEASAGHDAVRLSVGKLETKVLEGEKLQVQFFSTPKHTVRRMATQSTSTQTDTLNENALEDFKREQRSVTADLSSTIENKSSEVRLTIENKSSEVIFELRDIIQSSHFYTIRALVQMMDSIDIIRGDITVLAEQILQIQERLDLLGDQLHQI